MADVRALLAAEKSSRRITHPYATYTKSGALSCKACDLAIRSEALWDGHLKSTNHRKNAARIAAGQINREYHTPTSATSAGSAPKTLKRKIEDVDEHDAQQEEREYKVDGSKKPRSRIVSATESSNLSINTTVRTEKPSNGKHVHFSPDQTEKASEGSPSEGEARRQEDGEARQQKDVEPSIHPEPDQSTESAPLSAAAGPPPPPPPPLSTDVDEDEWAAFESDMTSLKAQEQQTQQHSEGGKGNYSGAVISAAPVSAETIRAQETETELQRKKLRDTEIEDEKEDEGRRLEEEFEMMQEMEEKVRRLKEKRESLRIALLPPDSNLVTVASNADVERDDGGDDDAENSDGDGGSRKKPDTAIIREEGAAEKVAALEDSDDDDDDVDDWYS